MKIILALLILIFFQSIAFGQDNKLIKDLDNDSIKDTVYYIDRHASKLICRLSTQNFSKMESKELDILGNLPSIESTKNGFEFSSAVMRAGSRYQFRYDIKTKRIQLIGMSRYSFGNATNDGSGESSINLLTNSYIGNWNFHDEKRRKLIKIPTIKEKMIIPKTYLEDFSDDIYYNFLDKCSVVSERHEQMMKNKK